MKFSNSEKLFQRAQVRIPGGVNSPVRAFKSVGQNPVFIAKANGSKLWDVDGNEFIDYVGSWGPMILGHAHPVILEAIQKAAVNGTSFGAATEREVEMAELVCSIMPSVEMIRMVNSGTEATMSAIRLARAYTGKEKIIKFEGCYHGHADSFLIKAGSGAMTLGVPDSPGVPQSIASGTLTARYNDLKSVEELFTAHPGQIAAIIVEPVVGNMGCIPPQQGFLEGLRSICTKQHALFIVDEVMTGFRVAPGGAQQLYNVTPDLTTLGKIIGGGLPVGAYGGKKEIMQMVAPSGPMYQAGTLSGNPVAVASGLATMAALKNKDYIRLNSDTTELCQVLEDILRRSRVTCTINRAGSMFTVFFTGKRVRDYASAKSADANAYGRFFRSMLGQGIYTAPSQFEANFVSFSHTALDIKKTIMACARAMKRS